MHFEITSFASDKTAHMLGINDLHNSLIISPLCLCVLYVYFKLLHLQSDSDICQNIKSDLIDLEAYNLNSVSDQFWSDAQLLE